MDSTLNLSSSGGRHRPGSSDGFSLVEVLVAVAILATAAATLPGLFLSARRGNALAGELTWATTLAAQKVEELRAGAFPDASAGELVEFLDQDGRPADTPDTLPRAYVRRWRVEMLPASPVNAAVIAVSVSRYRADGVALAPGERPRPAAHLVALRARSIP